MAHKRGQKMRNFREKIKKTVCILFKQEKMKIKNNGPFLRRAHATNLLKFMNLENMQRALLLSSAAHLSRSELSDNFYEKKKTYIKYNKLLIKMRNLQE